MNIKQRFLGLKHRSRWLSLIVIVICVSISMVSVSAQGTSDCYGYTNSSISSGYANHHTISTNEMDVYRFYVNSGDDFIVAMNPDNDLDAVMEVHDSYGNYDKSDGPSRADTEQISERVLQSGYYCIFAYGFEGDAGGYYLTLSISTSNSRYQVVPTASLDGQSSSRSETFPYACQNAPIVGSGTIGDYLSIGNKDYFRVYLYDNQSIFMETIDADFDTTLLFYMPDELYPLDNDDGGYGYLSKIAHLATTSQYHCIVVGSFNNSQGGDYTLSVDIR